MKPVREHLSNLVGENPDRFHDIFENQHDGVHRWMQTVKQLGAWGREDEFKIFARPMGLAIHVIDSEHSTVSVIGIVRI